MGFRKPVLIERREGGTWTDSGKWIAGYSDTIRIYASVQPLNMKEYTAVQPEGGHTVRAVKVYSSVELFTDREPQQEADILLWQGSRWKVVQCDAYRSGVLNHYKSYALEVIDRAAGTQNSDT